VILRFGLFYGRGAEHSEQIMAMALRHIGFQAGRPDSYVSSIHLGDAASAVAAALDTPLAPTTSSTTAPSPPTTTP
jgi:nucleoside-diphosphate-sugar epimerase